MSINKLAGFSTSAIVAISIIIGLIHAGSPNLQRLERLDNKRVSDLREIVYGIDLYTDRHGTLPTELADIVEGRRVTRLPNDPVTGIAYTYTIDSPKQYKLCARFDLPSPEHTADDFWAHAKGDQCYLLERKFRK